jgi:hypothetical protein
MPSQTAQLLEQSLTDHIVPLLSPIGLQRMPYPETIQVGLVARTLGRRLDSRRVFHLTCWCDGGTLGDHFSWRADVYDGQIWDSLLFTFPFERIGYPPAKPMRGPFSLSDFHPTRSVENFRRAIRFLGLLLVAHHQELAQQLPELAPDISRAVASEAWQRALAEGPQLWARRLVQGEVDTAERDGVLAAVGGSMLIVEVGGTRHTFKVPGSGLVPGQPVHLSGWWRNPAGTESASVVRAGERTWRFDFFGRLQAD